MKRNPLLGLFLVATVLSFAGCKLSDLRTTEMKAAIDAPGSTQKARRLMQTCFLAHGADKWENYETVTFDFEDRFEKLKFASPFPGGGAAMTLSYVPDAADAHMRVKEGKKAGLIWGLSNWYSWEQKAKSGSERKWKHNRRIKFWLPTWQYFLQLPLKIMEAPIMRHGGEREIQGKKYEILFATWNTDEPQKEYDQYALYINAETKLIDLVEYTVRGVNKSVVGTCVYSGYKQVEGIQIPLVMNVLGPKIDYDDPSILHVMKVNGVEFNQIDQQELQPTRDE
ncbi:MAG: hypothetical protein AAF998_03650 [Bacteroidota bacterium]